MKFLYTILPLAIIGLIIIGFSSRNEQTLSPEYFINKVKEQNKNLKADELIANRKQTSAFENAKTFSLAAQQDQRALNEFVRTATFLRLNKTELTNIISSNKTDINFSIPVDNNKSMELELTQVQILPKDFKVEVYKDGATHYENFNPGLYYRGIIKGDNTSWAAISFFDNEVIGVISCKNGNYNLGTIKDNYNKSTDNYVFYNDKDLIVHNNFKCNVDNHETKLNVGYRRDWNKIKQQAVLKDNPTTEPVKIYFVADYDMYVRNNSSTAQVLTYVTGFFNSVATIYGNEQIPFQMASTMFVYTSTDPYAFMNDSYEILINFGGNTKDNFNGDLAHLLSTGHGGQLGGIANINVLCQSYNPADSSGRFCFSNIESGVVPPYPVYSWNVELTTHEMGHCMASRHTHACVWPVNGPSSRTPIDTCVLTAENSTQGGFSEGCVNDPPSGSCYTPNGPAGTIMSYCHFCQNRGINFSNGFGPLPGDTIRYGYALATCLGANINSSELPVTYDIMQNYPNPFNPSTQITFAIPKESYATVVVYDILGREVARLVENKFYSPGYFTVEFNTSSYQMASGIYFYRLIANQNGKIIYSQIKKMALVK